MNWSKYKKYPAMDLKDRSWPSKTIDKAPIWCSVDLRDGNQALPVPMSVEKKLKMFNLLKTLGFKEIEVAFPSASNTDFRFVRTIIERGFLDEDTVIQVLTQSREHLIRRTFESIQGAKKAIVHLYNSTSEQQRRIVFKKDKSEIIEIALQGARLIKQLSSECDQDIRFEYSPESFTGTEMEFALEICEAVLNVWQPSPERKVIINLPATIEMATPNIYADQIEWFCRHISCRDSVIISLHAHNDRGTGVAATELALLAGADRVEGTLFGNGERTGNVDIINLAMNLYSQGINPELNITNMDAIIKTYEACTDLRVHERHPYAGQLVFTAFSGSHQDAINKGFRYVKEEKPKYWDVPYLPIDPTDIGREYEAIIRINSQSGKGGVAFVMEHEFGYHLPKAMHPEFGDMIKQKSDSSGKELSPEEIMEVFKEKYLEAKGPVSLSDYSIESRGHVVHVTAKLVIDGKNVNISGTGNGPISAFFDALKNNGISKYRFEDYEGHALTSGADAEAVAYIQLANGGGRSIFGVGKDQNTTTASFQAIICALNRVMTTTK
ncbi:MAG: 2-isopropylmalate synthase [Clostridiaceae bacterium]|jgi:2-isopropylmalate synthase|nr:2-isopropylmalate synthase [Clostridiaceae bacterium]